MNRIYQGRVSSVQIPKPGVKNEWQPLDNWQDALWQHHELFQDAVNYYIVALASLGTSPEGKLTRLQGLLANVWSGFDKKGQRRQGMGESLKRTWQLAEPPTLAEAVARFQQPLIKHGVKPKEMELAGESLAQDLGGEASIRNGGREYWPYYCQSGFSRGVTFPRSAGQLAKENAQSLMAEWIWDGETTAAGKHLAGKLKQEYFCNLVAGEGPLDRERTVEIFKEALEALLAGKCINAEQKCSWSAVIEKTTPEIAAYAGGSINKDALKKRFYGFLIFKHLSPDSEGLAVLRCIYEKPEPKQPKKTKVPTEKEQIEARLRSLADDPIKLVRDKAQIVFRAFTALPPWPSDSPSEELHKRSAFPDEITEGIPQHIAWKDFDIEAFKEALKVYNQFQQNLDKREEKLTGLAAKLLLMDGEQAWHSYAGDSESDQKLRRRLEQLWRDTEGKPKPPKNEAGEELVIASFKGDPRIDRLRRIINDDLAEEYRLTDGRRTPYGLRRRTMKGWSEVKRRWQTVVKSGTKFSAEKRDRLKEELDALRSGEKREQIGSHKLFEALIADEAAWSVWREPDDALQEKINKGWAADPLEAFRDYCEVREAFEEVSARPLNFTPADARYSRRLFMFTDACSFGNDTGLYRHDLKELAVTVPVALKGADGRLAEQPCRIVYSAPRLFRDQIRGEDGIYAQDWVQPMMRALFGEADSATNPQKLKDAAVQLMPDYDGKGQRRVLLNFPFKLDESQIQSRLGKAALWQQQFVSWKKGKQLPFLSWKDEFDGKEPHRWWETISEFHVLAADLGTRHAASVALVACGKTGGGTARFIGRAGDNDWFSRYLSGSILRLPGENAVVLRPESRLDEDKRGKAFREELYGERGRSATDEECVDSFSMLSALRQPELLAGMSTTTELQQRFSLPELNDKLLVAVRRTQNWIAACISWHWKLTQPDNEGQRTAALIQLKEQDRMPDWKRLAEGSEAMSSDLRRVLHEHISAQRQQVQQSLLLLTRRILPLRGRDWEWVPHPEKPDCHLLRQKPEGTGPDKVKLRGQRGLNMTRIEQISELRRRWQSLNQSLRREIGKKPPTAAEMRDDPSPDPCPDILRKLENIREQRVNQTAHLILAEALGLKLREPKVPVMQRTLTDMHGEYRVSRDPVDFIVLEDLSRYLSDQGRAKSENTRLMKWCHRAITMKVKMLAEPFGLPVLETPAAYTSRFCSLTGAAGFRAAEVGWDDRHQFRWRILREEAATACAEGKQPTKNAACAEALFTELDKISRSDKPHLTLLAPQPGGPIFVTAKEVPHPKSAKNKPVSPMQADINAAINIALRAVAHPGCPDIHTRLRTERKKGAKNQADSFLTRETRRFGKEKVAIIVCAGDMPKERNTNLFYDKFGVAQFGRTRLETDPDGAYPYASGPGLWKTVNNRTEQWSRCHEINNRRLAKWRGGKGEKDVTY